MALPFVRELFADVEKLPAFARVASRLKEGTGRIGVSGLTPTAKALLLVLAQTHHRAASDLRGQRQPSGRGTSARGAGLRRTDWIRPSRGRLSRCRRATCFRSRISRRIRKSRKNGRPPCGRSQAAPCRSLIAPIAATTIRLASTEYYIDLARTIRRGETIDTEPLLEHLNTVGYASS